MIRHLWPLLAGFGLWVVAFVVLYGLQYLGCRFGWDPAAHRLALVGGYAVALLALAGTLVFQLYGARRRKVRSMLADRVGPGTTMAALAATAVTFGPTLAVSICT